MKIITDENCTGYSSPGHPERPGRISRTVDLLREQKEMAIDWAQPGACVEEAILRAHSADVLERLNVDADFDSDTPFYPNIGNYARASVGAALEALRCARNGESVGSSCR